MKCYLLGIIVLFIFDRCERRGDKIVNSFLDTLPQISNALIEIDSSRHSIPFVNTTSRNLASDTGNIIFNVSDLLSNKLLLPNGDTIQEVQNSTANRRIRVSTCANNIHYIVYPTKETTHFSSYSLVFFRYHEYAHHLLGHVDCGQSIISTPQSELNADCKACLLLLKFGMQGVMVISNVQGAFFTDNQSGNDNYPSSKERSNNIVRCVNENK